MHQPALTLPPAAPVALPLGKPLPSYWFQNAYEALAPCSGLPAAQCCSGVGHAFAQNVSLHDGFSMRYDSLGFQRFSLDVTVRPDACICHVRWQGGTDGTDLSSVSELHV